MYKYVKLRKKIVFSHQFLRQQLEVVAWDIKLADTQKREAGCQPEYAHVNKSKSCMHTELLITNDYTLPEHNQSLLAQSSPFRKEQI